MAYETSGYIHDQEHDQHAQADELHCKHCGGGYYSGYGADEDHCDDCYERVCGACNEVTQAPENPAHGELCTPCTRQYEIDQISVLVHQAARIANDNLGDTDIAEAFSNLMDLLVVRAVA